MSVYSTLGITREDAIYLINNFSVSDMPDEVIAEVLFAIYRRYTLNNFCIEDESSEGVLSLGNVNFKDPSYD